MDLTSREVKQKLCGMKTKKGRMANPEVPLQETAETVASAERTAIKERFQLSFDLNEDGSPDLSSMRGKTKERVQQFFSDPKMAAAFGVKPPAQPEVEIFNPFMIRGMYSMLGSVEALAVSRLTKIPEPICKRVFTYTPEEIAILTPPTCRVLNKYVSAWMIKYQDEIALASTLMSMTITKVNMALMLAKAQTVNATPTTTQDKTEETDKKEEDGPRTSIQ